MTKPHMGLTTAPAPAQDDDVAAARARLMAAEAAAVEARDAERARQRDRQIVMADDARTVLKTLDPALTALKAWNAGALTGEAVQPTRLRLFGPEVLQAQDHAIGQVAALQEHARQGSALEGLTAELAGPTVLSAERLDEARAQLDAWAARFASIPDQITAWYRARAEAVAVHQALMKFSAQHVDWLAPPKGA